MKHINNIYQNDRIVLKDALPLELPLCISIEPTNICNFKCIMCHHGTCEGDEAAKPFTNMSGDIFNKTIFDIKEWLSEYESKRIKLIKLYSTGEPLIHPNICGMIKQIKDANICDKIEITTNASLLTKEIADKLVEYGLDICRISVYSVDEKKNERITQSKVKPETIRNNVEYLYRIRGDKLKPHIIAKMIDAGEVENRIFEKTYRDISDLIAIDELMQNGLDDNNTYNTYYGEPEGGVTDRHSDNINQKRRVCRYPFTHLTVRNDGSVVVCCSDWLKEICVGNVREKTLKEIWNSKTLYYVRKNMLKYKGENYRICRSCDIPYRDSPKDDINDITIERFTYMR